MRIVAKKNVTPPPSGDLRDGERHEMNYLGGRRKTDTGFENLIICKSCSSEYTVEDCDWFDVGFLETILAGKFQCPVCKAA